MSTVGTNHSQDNICVIGNYCSISGSFLVSVIGLQSSQRLRDYILDPKFNIYITEEYFEAIPEFAQRHPIEIRLGVKNKHKCHPH